MSEHSPPADDTPSDDKDRIIITVQGPSLRRARASVRAARRALWRAVTSPATKGLTTSAGVGALALPVYDLRGAIAIGSLALGAYAVGYRGGRKGRRA